MQETRNKRPRPVLILKTGDTLPAIVRARGNFEDWIEAGLGLPAGNVETVEVFQGEPLPRPDSLSGVVITGSPAMVTDRVPWIVESEAFLREAVAGNLPVLGICFGHQLLAQALGGRVDWHPGGREIGTVDVATLEPAAADPLFSGLPGIFPAHVTHMQSVMTIPANATVLAGNAFDPHQGVRFAEHAWGTQFHPEFDDDIMTRYIRERYARIREEGLDPDRLLAQVRPAPQAHDLLKRFAGILVSPD